MATNVATALSRKVKIAIVVVSKAVPEISAATPPLANLPKVPSVTRATKDVAPPSANSHPLAPCVVQAPVNVTHKRPAQAPMGLVRQTPPPRMEMAAETAFDVPAVNARAEIFSARLSWAAILPAMTHMLATAKPAV